MWSNARIYNNTMIIIIITVTSLIELYYVFFYSHLLRKNNSFICSYFSMLRKSWSVVWCDCGNSWYYFCSASKCDRLLTGWLLLDNFARMIWRELGSSEIKDSITRNQSVQINFPIKLAVKKLSYNRFTASDRLWINYDFVPRKSS